MLGLIRVTILLATILVLGMAAVIGVARSTERESPAANWAWRPFATNGGSYKAPPGWSVYDSFSTSTPHGALTCSEPICPLTTHVAYFRRDSGNGEFFAIYGTNSEMEALLSTTRQTIESCASQRGRETGSIHLFDGTDAKYTVTRVKLGGQTEITFFVATREDENATLLLSGGARTGDFDLEEFLTLARKVHSPTLSH